ncbi:hypothetical protein FACS1894184_12740 [Clostridia bacterium]|nr:hypothetical protein FACS1894184_12740 [Clostridia bacterium]
MSLLEELVTIMNALGIPVETGAFSDVGPDMYVVLTPLADTFELNADDCPGVDVQEVRISLYTKTNPRSTNKRIIRQLLEKDITITARMYIEYETDTQLHHYEMDCVQQYPWDDEEEE